MSELLIIIRDNLIFLAIAAPFGIWWIQREGRRSETKHLIAAAPVLLAALRKAYHELDEILVRDGVPYTHKGCKSPVDHAYFASVVEECRTAIRKAEARL